MEKIIRIIIKGETVNYFCPSEFFADYFRTIKQMVPGTEYTPAVLLTSEDYDAAI